MKPSKGIAQWPTLERPRELLLSKGPKALTEAELIAILLRVGRRGEDAVSLARKILQQFGGLGQLLQASPQDLKNIPGLGPAKIAILKCVREIVNRFAEEKLSLKKTIYHAQEAFDLVKLPLKGLPHEVFKVFYLTQMNEILALEDLSEGTINGAYICPRQLIKRAFELDAVRLILVHNHPSGNLEPSREDILITRNLFKACEIVGLQPLDHLIIGANDYQSLLSYL